MSYNIYVEDLISGQTVLAFLEQTPKEIEKLFRVHSNGFSNLGELLGGVHLYQVRPTEWIGTGFFIYIIERSSFYRDMENLRDHMELK